MELDQRSPPEFSAGGDVCIRIVLLPQEAFRIRQGRLDLSLLTTRFSRTVLDGYQEHTSEQVWGTAGLFENTTAQPGVALVNSTELLLPEVPAPDSQPVRMQWQAKVRFDVVSFREFSAALYLRDATPHEGGAPVVDGTGFLPLYEFRTSPDS